jgi:hypothetical protein
LTYTVPPATPGLGGPYAFTPNNFPAGFACPTTTNSGNCSDGVGVGGAAGTFNTLNVTVKDTANASTPQGSVNSTNGSLTVDAEMTLTPPASPFPAAVLGRRFGVNTDTCVPGPNCIPVTYTVPAATPGLGGYTFTPNNFPTGFTCGTAGSNGNCLDSTSVGGAAGTFNNLNVSVNDTANASTPSNTVTSTNGTITVDAEMTLTPPGSPFPDAVLGRHYGVSTDTCVPGPNCAPLTYTVPPATPGLGTYTFTPNNFPAGFACTTSTNTGNCLDSTSVGGTANTFNNLNVSVSDTANASTPSNTITSTNGSLTVHNVLALSTNLTSPFPDAVVNRHYGVSSDNLCTAAGNVACTSLIYTASGGLLNGSNAYASMTTNGTTAITPGASFPLGFSCAANTPLTTLTCSAAPVSNTVTAGSYSPSVTVNDTANSATPAGNQADPGTLVVTAQLAVNNPTPSPIPDAVNGRVYGTPTTLQYTVTTGEGLAPVSLSGTGFPTGITCTTQTDNTDSANTMPCNSGANPVTGTTSTGTVTVTDTANATTPAATSGGGGTDPNSSISAVATTQVTVDPELVIQNASVLPNGEKNQPYSVLFTCQAPLNTGTCGGTGSPGNAAAMYTWAVSNNNITGVGTGFPVAPPTPVAPLQATYGAIFAGTPTATGSAETVTITVADNGSATTPSCTTAGTCPTNTSFTASILPSQAYVGSNANNAIDVFDTSGGVGSVSFVSTITTTTGGTPNYIAISNNGDYGIAADPGVHELYIQNLQTSATTTVANGQGLDNASGDTAAVAVGPQAVTGSPNSLSSPDDVFAYVANSGSDNVQVVDANPADTNFGNVTSNVTTITFTGGPYTGFGPVDLKVAPTFKVAVSPANPLGRLTHAYVARPRDVTGDSEVCVFDAEPSDTSTFLTQIAAANSPNGDNCIGLGAAATYLPKFIDVSPDGLYAYVTVTDGAGNGSLEIIDTNPNDAGTFETVIDTISLNGLSPSCLIPAGVRVAPDGQTVWVACHDTNADSQLVAFETALVGINQFTQGAALATANPATDYPIGIAFRPDAAFGLATLSGDTAIVPFTISGVGAVVADSVGTSPWGIDHIPNPVLHITTTALPQATHANVYQSSIVANGPNRYFTFTDITAPASNLASIGLALSSDGEITGTPTTAGSYTFTIQVTDQSLPVNNLVVQTVTLTVI